MLEAELMGRDHWTRDNLLTYQRERVRALVSHAVSQSPYYREALGPDAAEQPLAKLPTLPKATLMAEFDRVVTDPRLRLADLRSHLAADDPSQSFLGAFRVATTSGTTGRRSIVAFTNDEAAVWREFDFVAELLSDGREHLCGDRFGAADLTFAALSASMIVPPVYGVPLPQPDILPPHIAALVKRAREHPAGRYAMALFEGRRSANRPPPRRLPPAVESTA